MPTTRPDPPQPPPGPDGAAEREYGHSSGDRNTRTDEHDWKHFEHGKERTDHAEAAPEPSTDPES